MQKILKEKSGPDFFLLVLIIILTLWGIVEVGTISFPFSLQKYGQPWVYLLHQLEMLFVGVVLGLLFYKLPLEKLKKISPFLFFANLVLLLIIFLPNLGFGTKGAQRWLDLKFLNLQPSEFLKITFAMYLSAWLAEKIQRLKKSKADLKIFAFFLFFLGILAILLLLQPNMSTLAIICVIGLAIYFCAKTPIWHTLAILFGGAGIGLLLIKIAPYRLNRLSIFLNPEADPLGKGYQIKQALIAIGSGKIFGIGQGFSLGLSRQKFGFLPEPMTDSIFAIIGEELGFLGALFLVFLFCLFLWKVLKIARCQENNFEKFLAVGIGVWITFQAFFNIAGITGIMPLGGIPLPFFSYGGSHLITEMMAMGLLLNISKI